MTAAALVVAWATDYLVLWAFGWMGVVLALCALVAVVLRPGLEVERSIHPARVTVGDKALGTVVVTNRSRRPTLAQTGQDWVGDRPRLVPLPALLPHRSKIHHYGLPTDRRAAVKVGPFVVRQSDPFSLLVRERDHGELVEFFVHPYRHPLSRLPSSRRLSLDGPTSDRAPNGSTTFHAIRQYVPGDDRRHVHWKVSARKGELMVRQLVDTSEPSLLLVLDVGRGRYRDPIDFEGAVEIVASLVEAASEVGFSVRVHTTDGDRWVARREDPDGLLDRLAGVDLVPGASLDRTAHRILAGARGPTAMLVGGRFDAGDAIAVESLRSHFAQTSIVTVGETEVSLGPDHSVVAGGSEFASLWNEMAIG